MIVLNVPFYASPAEDPIHLMRKRLGRNFYIVNFQDSDEADRRFAEDVPHFFDIMMRRRQVTRARFDQLPAEKKVLSLLAAMDRKQSGGELRTVEEQVQIARAFDPELAHPGRQPPPGAKRRRDVARLHFQRLGEMEWGREGEVAEAATVVHGGGAWVVAGAEEVGKADRIEQQQAGRIEPGHSVAPGMALPTLTGAPSRAKGDAPR